jgi:uncharacterized protein (DUF1697 family)
MPRTPGNTANVLGSPQTNQAPPVTGARLCPGRADADAFADLHGQTPAGIVAVRITFATGRPLGEHQAGPPPLWFVRERRYDAAVLYAVFLRAINVGKANRIKMADLRELCETLGFRDVETYVQTGNVVAEWPGPAEGAATVLEAALVERGLKNVTAMVRTRDELAEALALLLPSSYDDTTVRAFVNFFREPIPPPMAETLRGLEAVVSVRERELLTLLPIGQTAATDPVAALSKKHHVQGTARYWTVANTVLEMMDRRG